METAKYKRTKFACYTAYFTMSSVFSLPPLLFMTLRQMYRISYTLLGTLVLVNFCTQLAIDLIFTVFSKKFNVKKVVKIMPLITATGLFLYALIPMFFPNIAYFGLLVGTILFSVSAGLSEVLLSPMIAAIPSKNPQRDMSFLHSLYAFGVFTVVVISTLFFKLFKAENWVYLTMFFAVLPIFASVLFMISPMPDMDASGGAGGVEGTKKRAMGLVLCVACIFFGSCAENVMSNWISSYMENAIKINKTLGDILGMAGFAILLGLMRFSYSRFGKNITKTLLISMIGAAVCYLVVSFSTNPVVAVIACALAGLCTAMLWPGTLIMMEEKLPGLGVAAYALMAAGGDLGAAIAPQLMGVVTDSVAQSQFAAELGAILQLSAEQIGLKAGMLFSSLFPIIGIGIVIACIFYFKKHGNGAPVLLVGEGVAQLSFASESAVQTDKEWGQVRVENKAYLSLDGKKYLRCIEDEDAIWYTVPEGVEEICGGAFAGYNAEVELLDGVKIVRAAAFADFVGEVTVPSSVTEIENGAFGESAVIVAIQGSFAQEWAKENGIRYKEPI